MIADPCPLIGVKGTGWGHSCSDNFNVSEFLQLVVIIYLSAAVFVPLIWNDGIMEQWNIGNKRPKKNHF